METENTFLRNSYHFIPIFWRKKSDYKNFILPNYRPSFYTEKLPIYRPDGTFVPTFFYRNPTFLSGGSVIGPYCTAVKLKCKRKTFSTFHQKIFIYFYFFLTSGALDFSRAPEVRICLQVFKILQEKVSLIFFTLFLLVFQINLFNFFKLNSGSFSGVYIEEIYHRSIELNKSQCRWPPRYWSLSQTFFFRMST